MRLGDSIPGGEDVVRYVGGSLVNDYGIDGAAFVLSANPMLQDELGLSCNWLGYFTGISRRAQVDRVRGVIHRTLGRDAVFGELNIQVTLDAISGDAPQARFAHKPEPADERFPYDDPSHCELLGLPGHGTHQADRLGDKIAKLVQQTYPAQR